MKLTTLLLAVSLVANVALVGVLYFSRFSTPVAASGSAGESSAKNSAGADHSAKSDALRAALASGDITALEAAGLSPEVARQLALGRAFAHFAAAMRNGSGKSADGKWWQKPDPSRLTREQRDQLAQARREMSDALIAATGSDLMSGNNLSEANLSFLAEAKRDALRRILSDYQDMMDQYGSAGGISLASDREKMKLLREERDRDIAAALSPEEFADYQMRTSATADLLRSRYGNAITSEDEFKQLYALQKTFDDKFPVENLASRVTPDGMKARSDAALQLQNDMRAAVGDDAYAALSRASDSDLRSVDALVARLNLAPDTTDRVAAERDSYAAESQRIMADTATPFPERRAQLQQLATQAKSDLTATLGAEAADAYAQRSPWVSMLQNGIGYSTNAKDSPNAALSLSGIGGATPSVFPVMPAGVAGSGTRQVVNMISTSGGPGASGGQMFFAPTGSPGSTATTQVYSVTSTVSGDGHPTSGTSGTTATKIITTPSSDTPAPVTPPKE